MEEDQRRFRDYGKEAVRRERLHMQGKLLGASADGRFHMEFRYLLSIPRFVGPLYRFTRRLGRALDGQWGVGY